LCRALESGKNQETLKRLMIDKTFKKGRHGATFVIAATDVYPTKARSTT
jgi:hypothetical protein